MIKEGTIIHGTMRPQDVIPALTEELKRIDPREVYQLRDRNQEIYTLLEGEKRWICNTWMDGDARFDLATELLPYLEDAAQDLVDNLINDLDLKAPEGMRFGAHEGDGSDLGWWSA